MFNSFNAECVALSENGAECFDMLSLNRKAYRELIYTNFPCTQSEHIQNLLGKS